MPSAAVISAFGALNSVHGEGDDPPAATPGLVVGPQFKNILVQISRGGRGGQRHRRPRSAIFCSCSSTRTAPAAPPYGPGSAAGSASPAGSRRAACGFPSSPSSAISVLRRGDHVAAAPRLHEREIRRWPRSPPSSPRRNAAARRGSGGGSAAHGRRHRRDGAAARRRWPARCPPSPAASAARPPPGWRRTASPGARTAR